MSISPYTEAVEVATGVVFLSDPLLFGPSGIMFIESGVEIEFVADPASLMIPSDKQILLTRCLRPLCPLGLLDQMPWAVFWGLM